MTQDTLATNETTIDRNVLDKLENNILKNISKYHMINHNDKMIYEIETHKLESIISNNINNLIKKLNL